MELTLIVKLSKELQRALDTYVANTFSHPSEDIYDQPTAEDNKPEKLGASKPEKEKIKPKTKEEKPKTKEEKLKSDEKELLSEEKFAKSPFSDMELLMENSEYHSDFYVKAFARAAKQVYGGKKISGIAKNLGGLTTSILKDEIKTVQFIQEILALGKKDEEDEIPF
jgi:hypothetical protein